MTDLDLIKQKISELRGKDPFLLTPGKTGDYFVRWLGYPDLLDALERALEALECCARPGTYHLVGDVQEWGNYKARSTISDIAEILGKESGG